MRRLDSTLKVINAWKDLREIGLAGVIVRPPVRPRKLNDRSFESKSVVERAFARQKSFAR